MVHRFTKEVFEEVFWLSIKQLDGEFRVFKQIDARESFSTNQNQN